MLQDPCDLIQLIVLARYASAVVHRYQCIDIFIPFCAASEHSGGEDEVLKAEQQDDLNETILVGNLHCTPCTEVPWVWSVSEMLWG